MKGFKITKGSDVLGQLKKYRDTYNERGKYLGFPAIDEHYSMMLGTCTDWTGFPRSGKTQVLMELLLNTSMYYGWRHLVYFPDVGNNVEIIADLLHKKTGKTFNPKFDNVITDAEIQRELDWLCHHFLVLTKADVKAKLTPVEFWDYAVKVKEEQGLETASIDSWKDLHHDTTGFARDDKYLEYVLSYRNHIAEEHNLHLHTIIHPKLTEKENGKRKAPTPYDLKGGSEWFNNGKCMVTVHRDDVTDIKAQIIFHKIKPRACGSVGQVDLCFDVKKLVYYTLEVPEPNMFIHHYAAPRDEKKVETNTISANLNKYAAEEELWSSTKEALKEYDTHDFLKTDINPDEEF